MNSSRSHLEVFNKVLLVMMSHDADAVFAADGLLLGLFHSSLHHVRTAAASMKESIPVHRVADGMRKKDDEYFNVAAEQKVFFPTLRKQIS